MPNVHLTPQMTDFIEREVASGAYANASEVVRAAMRTLMDIEGAYEFYRLKADLTAAWEQTERGEFAEFSMEDFIASKLHERGAA